MHDMANRTRSEIGRSSKEKGKRGEREAAELFRDHGFDVRRSVQYNGREGAADLVGAPGLHIEVKRVERLNIETAVKQMERDADPGRIKTLFHRKNGGEWLVTMTAEDFFEVYKRWANENCTG